MQYKFFYLKVFILKIYSWKNADQVNNKLLRGKRSKNEKTTFLVSILLFISYKKITGK